MWEQIAGTNALIARELRRQIRELKLNMGKILGARGGKKRAEILSPERRQEIARMGGLAKKPKGVTKQAKVAGPAACQYRREPEHEPASRKDSG